MHPVLAVHRYQWRRVAILVRCPPGSLPVQNYEGSPAVVVVANTICHSNT